MPLDPQCAVYVDLVNASDVRWNDDTDPEQATLAWGATLALGAGELPELESVTDVDAGGVPVRIYRPAAGVPLPLVLYFHGGGFTIGSIDSHDPIPRRLAAAVPAVFVSVEYRTGPANRFPAAHDDAWTALMWARAHATEFGADPERIGLLGDSVGATLVAYLAIRSRDAGGLPLAFQGLWLPLVNAHLDEPSVDEFAKGYVLDRDALEWFRRSYTNDEAEYDDWRLSPLRAEDLTRLPQAFVATAEFDPLRDQGEAFVARLRDAGVAVEHVKYEGAFHPFYGLVGFLEVAQRLEDDTVTALREVFA